MPSIQKPWSQPVAVQAVSIWPRAPLSNSRLTDGRVLELDVELERCGPAEHLGHRATEVAGQVEQVAAVIEQRAAAGERPCPEAGRYLGAAGPVMRLPQPDERDATQLAGVDHRLGCAPTARFDRRWWSIWNTTPGLAAGGDHLVRLRQRQGDGLLAQHVLAGRRGGEGRRVMRGVGRADGDRVEARQLQQVPEVGECVPDGPFCRARLRGSAGLVSAMATTSAPAAR